MKINVLVVDIEPDLGVHFLGELAWSDVQVPTVDKLSQAIKNVKRKEYDFILIGDRLQGGDTVDFALAFARFLFVLPSRVQRGLADTTS